MEIGTNVLRYQSFQKGSREKKWFLWTAVLWIFLWSGCNSSEVRKEDCIITCASESCMTLPRFAYELSLKLAAYPYDLKDDPDQYNLAVIELAANLAEQCQLLCAAKGKGIKILPEELQKEEESLLEGYSDEELDQFMIEEALRRRIWKQKMEQDLLIRRLIQMSLVKEISITQEEISAFYALQVQQNKDNEPDWIKDTDVLVEKLKAKKAQENYEEWMEQIRAAYPVTINKELLKQFLIYPPDESKG